MTPTAQLFKVYFSKLAAAILDPERLANELYSKDLVGAGVRKEMTVIGQPSYHKTTRLLSAVECQIEMNPDSLGPALLEQCSAGSKPLLTATHTHEVRQHS